MVEIIKSPYFTKDRNSNINCTQTKGYFEVETSVTATPLEMDRLEHLTFLRIRIYNEYNNIIHEFTKNMDCDLDKDNVYIIRTPTFLLEHGTYIAILDTESDRLLNEISCSDIIDLNIRNIYMKLNIIYSGLGLSSLSDKPIWQQEAENELFAMIRASGITLSIQYYIDEPCSMQYREWDAGCGWVVHADARTLANTTPQDVFATLIFWKPPAPSIEFPIPCARYDGIAYQTFEIGFDKRPAFVVVADPDWGLECDDCTNDFRCVYGYILGHEFYRILEDWVKWKLLLDGPVDENGNSPNMPSGDNTELCENTIGLCQGTNPTSCIDTPTCDSTGCTERWGTKGSKPCYQCFFNLYLPEVDRLINEHDYVEPPPP